MTTSISGSFPAVNSDSDATINGLTVGKGTGTSTQSTSVGASALSGANTVGYNTAFGYFALKSNTDGANNVSLGNEALENNTTASQNTAVGSFALTTNTTGANNSALGQNALQGNTTGGQNSAFGVSALSSNTTANANTAIGYQALYSANRTADANAFNTAVGYQAGYAVTTGQGNAFIGNGAGSTMTSGSNNVIVGGYTGNNGAIDMRTLSNTVMISDGAGNARGYFNSNGYFSIGTRNYGAYGNAGLSVEGGGSQCVIVSMPNAGNDVISCWNQATSGNNSFITFYTEASPTARGSITYQRGSNQVSYGVSSDARLKENIVDAGSGLEKLAGIKIRSFDWKDSGAHTDFGVVAQELNEVAPEAVIEGAEKPEEAVCGEVAYWQVDTSFLVPAMIKAIQELKAELDSIKAELATLKAQP